MIVKELIDLLRKCPESDLLLIDSGMELDADIDWDIEDVLVGTGVLKGFSYLKIVKENEPANYNEPLTLDELREMEGEPVWVVRGECGYWRILDIIYKSGHEEFALFDDGSSDPLADYGKDWLAYRHKPEEA